MKKSIFGRKLKRDRGERKALFKGLMSSLVLHERIRTTEEKAKAIKPEIEKLVTKAKKGGNASINIIASSLLPIAFEKFMTNVAPRFVNRNGGYTRIVRLNHRLGDQAQTVLLEWVEGENKILNIKDKKEDKEINKKLTSKKSTGRKSIGKPASKKVTKTPSKKTKK